MPHTRKARRRADPPRIFDEDDPSSVRALYQAACGVIASLSPGAGRIMEGGEADALAYLDFPEAHRRCIRTNNVQERTNREIKRRARRPELPVGGGAIPGPDSRAAPGRARIAALSGLDEGAPAA